jgi:hypothetical protein
MVEYITPWTREPIKWGYQKWFDSLEHGAEVCLQKFNTPGECLRYPFETWSFEIGSLIKLGDRFKFSPKYGSDDNYLAADGSGTYYSGEEWGEVFPARVVPYHHGDLNIADDRSHGIDHLPIYEPLYLGMCRSVIAVYFGKNYSRRLHEVMRDRRCYTVKALDCELVHIFDEEPLNGMEGFLYSQYKA